MSKLFAGSSRREAAKWPSGAQSLWETHPFFDFSMNIANVMRILGIHHFYSFLDRAKYIPCEGTASGCLDLCAETAGCANGRRRMSRRAEARRVQQTWDICQHGGNLGILAGDTSSCSASDSLFLGGDCHCSSGNG